MGGRAPVEPFSSLPDRSRESWEIHEEESTETVEWLETVNSFPEARTGMISGARRGQRAPPLIHRRPRRRSRCDDQCLLGWR